MEYELLYIVRKVQVVALVDTLLELVVAVVVEYELLYIVHKVQVAALVGTLLVLVVVLVVVEFEWKYTVRKAQDADLDHIQPSISHNLLKV